MDQIKEAFRKVKEDIDFLKKSLEALNFEIRNMKEMLEEVVPNNTYEVPNNEYRQTNQQTDRQINSTIPTYNPTQNMPFKALNPQNQGFSSGNRGVPTDRQTNQQTDRQVQNTPFLGGDSPKEQSLKVPKNASFERGMDNALEMLNSLDSLKKEVRIKFKDLTDQEFLVFSTLYQLDEERGYSDYKTISNILHLSESSIRDYIGKLIKKEIPVEKIRINNKTIRLTVSPNLKKIASLQTILQLREL